MKRIMMQICAFIYYRIYSAANIFKNPSKSEISAEFEKFLGKNSKITQNSDYFSFDSSKNPKEIIENSCSLSDSWWDSYNEEEHTIQSTIFNLYLPEIEFILNNFYELSEKQVQFFKNLIEVRQISHAKDKSTPYDYRVFDMKTQEVLGS